MRHFLFSALIISSLVLGACSSDSTDRNNQTESDTDDMRSDTSNNLDKFSDLEGILWEADSDIGVVLSHGAIYDAASWEAQGSELAEKGITAFAVEDTSQNELLSAGKRMKDELSLDKVFLLGARAGGSSAIRAVNDDEEIFDKLALLSPGGDATTVKNMPVFVIYSEEEGYETLEEADGSNLRLLEFPGRDHAQELFNDKEKSKKIMEALFDFFEKEE
ncbi:MAG: hypothetical protein L0I88_06880 [Alkalibacterium sp.]|uniref:hypothetical protein n=1 Tax=Alkalibacterium gilvum TaxID=1130080 RepID=UPI0026547E76|nr:hypothetical protein [Alkalibacterium sp.]MDN6729377.1 hypothetical protein [Alkalibacterium sp.]